MIGYYLVLAWRSLRRNPALTALMILTVGFGVAASMTTWSVYRAVSGDPIPAKSSELFVPQIDNWGPAGHPPGSRNNEPPKAMDYTDAVALVRAHKAKYQSAMYRIEATVAPKHLGRHPVFGGGEAVYSEFFPMLDVPFEYGSPWTHASDAHRARVVVISRRLNKRLFGGGDSVGHTVVVGKHALRVVGVLDQWNPQPVFYDVSNHGGGFEPMSSGFFLPFTTAVALGMQNAGKTVCDSSPAQPGFVGLQHSECVWVAVMVQLDNPVAVSRYKQFLVNYVATQQQTGRFHWAPNVRLRGLMAWLSYLRVVPPNTRISWYLALGLLLVCLVNTTGLLLAKFMRRRGEVGVRRALGASRREIYTQFLVEAGLVGLAGGVLGLVLTILGIDGAGWVLPPAVAALARVDLPLLASTLGVAIVATILTGLYPAMRVAAIQPAWQLKVN